MVPRWGQAGLRIPWAGEVVMEQPKYQRVLLKLSGEALAGPAGRGGLIFPLSAKCARW